MLYPLSYSFPDHKILTSVPTKKQLFAYYQPGMSYTFSNEEEYLQGYRDALFGITSKKSGWDCYRHLEIMSQGCFPYFLDVDKIPQGTMTHYPKEKIPIWMNRYSRCDFVRTIQKYSSSQLTADIEDLLSHTRNNLSATSAVKSMYTKTGHSITEDTSVLLVTNERTYGYIQSNLIYGFKTIFGGPSVYESYTHDFLYRSYPAEEALKKYGKGMNYTRILDDSYKNQLSKERTIDMIRAREFDCIIYLDNHRCIDYLDIVSCYYDLDDVFLICENDCEPMNDPIIGWVTEESHSCIFSQMYSSPAHFFLREVGSPSEIPISKSIQSKEDFLGGMKYLYNFLANSYGTPQWEFTPLS